MVQVGQKIRNYTVVAVAYKWGKTDDLVIVVESDTEYVTARMSPNSTGEWFLGHYFQRGKIDVIEDVWADFRSRVLY